MELNTSGVPIPVVEGFGYLAATLVFLAFYTRTMMPLRVIAIASNVAFIIYAALAHLTPILVLHAVLLPLNLYRAWQLNRLIAGVAGAADDSLSIEWLLPYMRERRAFAGERLFTIGDRADEMFYIARGSVSLPELGMQRATGEVIGEIGLFSPGRQRTSSAVCTTECRLMTISGASVRDLYYQNPKFGWYLLNLITGRLVREVERLQRRS
ncbi:MAG: cyclic nucleotide-binding domain-containing protein [Chromatiaceae bacterium]|nr:cyclic nucleotide-binding domain-containing protein [Gammaproteobacteria bacterium]MCP5301052.1 cyclic nucleotide-binding domain-containing protein [Chromatiaceae bacterium]MCP5421476.1 cyclic nucleotide-binding domain-containing protein [Chromatiaceae bacterium]